VTDTPLSAHSQAALVAVTLEAQRALGGAGEVRLAQFPSEFWRERRSPTATESPPFGVREQRFGKAPSANDAYLLDEGLHHLHISGEHFAIERVDSRFFLVDRGSASGTVVAGTRVGGDREGGRIELGDGDQVIVGTRRSPYIFQCSVAPAES